MSMYEVYEEDDSILPCLELPAPCGVRIEIKDDTVSLFIGQRDWSWSRKTGMLTGAGTAITGTAVADTMPQPSDDIP